MKGFKKLRKTTMIKVDGRLKPMSQGDVVEKLNVSVGTVVNWDRGRGTTDEMKDKICELFVCSREELEG